jgi:hypothetical protein
MRFTLSATITKISFLAIATFACLGNVYAQNEFDFKLLKLNQIVSAEYKRGSIYNLPNPNVLHKLGNGYFPSVEKYTFAEPAIYTRPKKGLLPGATVSYYFTLKDSLLKLIEYDCIIKTGSGLIRAEDEQRYDSLYTALTNYYGKPVNGKYNATVEYTPQRGQITTHNLTWKKGTSGAKLMMAWTSNNQILWTRVLVY